MVRDIVDPNANTYSAPTNILPRPHGYKTLSRSVGFDLAHRVCRSHFGPTRRCARAYPRTESGLGAALGAPGKGSEHTDMRSQDTNKGSGACRGTDSETIVADDVWFEKLEERYWRAIETALGDRGGATEDGGQIVTKQADADTVGETATAGAQLKELNNGDPGATTTTNPGPAATLATSDRTRAGVPHDLHSQGQPSTARRCEVCHVWCNSPTQYDDHVNGRLHRSNLGREPHLRARGNRGRAERKARERGPKGSIDKKEAPRTDLVPPPPYGPVSGQIQQCDGTVGCDRWDAPQWHGTRTRGDEYYWGQGVCPEEDTWRQWMWID